MTKIFVMTIFNYLVLSHAHKPEIESSTGNESYDPVIILAKNAENDLLRATEQRQANLPPTLIKIFQNDPVSFGLKSNEEILYLCPYPDLKNNLSKYFDDKDRLNMESCLYETKFNGRTKKCDSKPQVVIEQRYSDKTGSCDFYSPSKSLYLIGLQFCSPTTRTSEGDRCFRKGIIKFMKEESQYRIFKRIIDMFEICYNAVEKRTESTTQKLKPLSDYQSALSNPSDQYYFHTMNPELTEDRFQRMHQAFNANDEGVTHLMVPHRMVPKGENTFAIWKIITSHYMNLAPLWTQLTILVYLVDDRIQRFCNEFKQSVYVTTKTLIYKFDGNFEEKYLNDDKEFPIPNIWSKQVYNSDNESGITVIIHNTPGQPPMRGQLCQVSTECKFQSWPDMSPLFHDQITDRIVQYAYCCESVPAKSPINQGVVISNVIDINFKRNTND